MSRVAIYVRTSIDLNQTVKSQLLQLNEVAARLGWVVVQVYTDEGISGTKGRDRRPAFDRLMKGITRREFDLVAVWSVCRLGRSLQDLVGLLGELQSGGVGLYSHTQAAGTGIRGTARRTKSGTASTMRIKQTLEAHAA